MTPTRTLFAAFLATAIAPPFAAAAAAGWGPPQQVGTAALGTPVSAQIDSDGVPRVAWGGVGPGSSDTAGVWVAERAVAGLWQSQQVAATAQRPFVALTGDALAWNVAGDPPGSTALNLSRRVAGTWSAPRLIGPALQAFRAPTVTVTSQGLFLAGRGTAVEVDAAPPFEGIRRIAPATSDVSGTAVFDAPTPVAIWRKGWGPIYTASRRDDGRWASAVQVSPSDQSGPWAYGPAVARDGNAVLVAWTFRSNHSVWIAGVNADGISRRPERLTARRAIDAPVVTTNASGEAAIAFTDRTVLGRLRYIDRVAVARRSRSGRWSTPTVVPGARGRPFAVSIARSGALSVAFHGPSPDRPSRGRVGVSRQSATGVWGRPTQLAASATQPILTHASNGDELLVWSGDANAPQSPVFARVFRAR